MKRNLLLTIIFSSTFAFAQHPAAKYFNTINTSEIGKHIFYIAGPETEGRGTGSAGQKKAGEYIINELKSVGIKPIPITQNNGVTETSYYQNVPLVESKVNAITLQINGKAFAYKDDYFINRQFSETEIKSNEIVFAGHGCITSKWNEIEAAKITGKIAVIFSGEPKNKKGIYYTTETEKETGLTLMQRVEKIAAYNPSLVIIVNQNYSKDAMRVRNPVGNVNIRFGTIPAPGTVQISQNTVVPTIQMSEDAAEIAFGKAFAGMEKSIAKISKKGAPINYILPASFSLKVDKEEKDNASENIVGFIKGKEFPNEIVVVSAHYDHLGWHDGKVYPGADDNGTGTTALITMAKAMQKAALDGNGPARSVLYLWVTGEERGLLGSEWYSKNPIFPLENTVVDLNVDMIGRLDERHKTDSNYIYIIGSDKLSNLLHHTNEKANSLSSNIKLDYTFNDEKDPNRFYYRSDHYNFAKNNIPVIFYFSGVHEDYHKATDTPDKIMLGRMKKVIDLVFTTTWEVANMPERIKADPDKIKGKD